MRKFLGALAIAVTAVVWSVPQAEAARCWWNGYTWECWGPPRPWVRHWRPHYRPWGPYYRPYAYYGPGWGYNRPWRGPRWYW